MSLSSHTLTLTRWHHVAQRLGALASSHLNEARGILAGVSVSSTLDDAQRNAFEARGRRGLQLLADGRAALAAVGAIRTMLASANGSKGVTALLAEAEDKRKQAKALEPFVALDLVALTPLARANQELDKEMQRKAEAFSGRSAVRVALVDPTALDALRAEKAALEADVAALTDRVAELNRATLTIELPTTLAKAVGL